MPVAATRQVLKEVDAVATAFEQAWGSGTRPDISDYLARAGEEFYLPVLRELVRLDWEYRLREGEQPTVEEYKRRFPRLDEPGSKYGTWDEFWAQAAGGSKIATGGGSDCETVPQTTGGVEVQGNLPGRDGIPQVDGYTLEQRLGMGGMGEVWRGVQHSTGRPVAVKLMNPRLLGSPRARGRFHDEVRLTAKLTHPNIARVYDSGVHRNVYFYAMELIDGVPLDNYVTERKLDRKAVLELMRLVCLAVDYAHERRVIHCDLKPSNILVDADGSPHVLDFGLAQAISDDEETEAPGAKEIAGTPAYMSPEQAAGNRDDLHRRTDVYTLGVILYERLTGRVPYDVSGNAAEVLERIATLPPMPPAEANPRAIDADLNALLLKTLARNPDDRYAGAAEVASDIGRYLGGDPLAARLPSATYVLRKKLVKQRRKILAGAITVAAILLFSAGFAAKRRMDAKYLNSLREQLAPVVGYGDISASELKDLEAVQKKREAEDPIAGQEMKRLIVARVEAMQQRKSNEKQATEFVQETIAEIRATRKPTGDAELFRAVEATLATSDLTPDVLEQVRIAIGKKFHDLSLGDDAVREFRLAIAERIARAPDTVEGLDAAMLYDGLAKALFVQKPIDAEGEAAGLWLHTQRIRQQYLRPWDPLRIETQGNVASLHFGGTSLPKAERMFLDSMSSIFGETAEQTRKDFLGDVAMVRLLYQSGNRAEVLKYLHRRFGRLMHNEVSREQLPDGLGTCALYLLHRGDRSGAEAVGRAAADLSAELNGQDHPMHAKILAYVGYLLAQVQRNPEGVQMLREAADISKRRGVMDLPMIEYRSQLATALESLGKAQEAAKEREDLLWDADASGENRLRNRALSLYSLGRMALEEDAAGDEVLVRAGADLQDACRLALASYPQGSHEYLKFQEEHEWALRRLHRYDQAVQLCNELLPVVVRAYGTQSPQTAVFTDKLGLALMGLGRPQEALAHFTNAYQTFKDHGGMPHEITAALRHLCDARRALGDEVLLQAALHELVDEDRQLLGDENERTIEDTCTLASTLAAQHRDSEAKSLYAKAVSDAVAVWGEQDKQTQHVRRFAGIATTMPATTQLSQTGAGAEVHPN